MDNSTVVFFRADYLFHSIGFTIPLEGWTAEHHKWTGMDLSYIDVKQENGPSFSSIFSCEKFPEAFWVDPAVLLKCFRLGMSQRVYGLCHGILGLWDVGIHPQHIVCLGTSWNQEKGGLKEICRQESGGFTTTSTTTITIVIRYHTMYIYIYIYWVC